MHIVHFIEPLFKIFIWLKKRVDSTVVMRLYLFVCYYTTDFFSLFCQVAYYFCLLF